MIKSLFAGILLVACFYSALAQAPTQVTFQGALVPGDVLYDLEQYIQANGGTFIYTEGVDGSDDSFYIARGANAASVQYNVVENIEDNTWVLTADQINTNNFLTTLIANQVQTELAENPQGALDAIGYQRPN